MVSHHQTKTLQKDEIDLRELGMVLIKRKWTILTMGIISMLLAVGYVWKLPTIYSGTVLIEIGNIIINSEPSNNKPAIIQPLENSNNIEPFILENQKSGISSIQISIPKESSNLIQLTCQSSDKKEIQNHLEKTVNLIIKRHTEKAHFFQKANALIHPTQVISSINITADPIKPKKQRMIALALISGLIMGIFLAFFLEFIQTKSKEKK